MAQSADSVMVDSVLASAAPHLATLESEGASTEAHDAAISSILASAADYIGSSDSPFSQDLMEEDGAACSEAMQLAAQLRGMRGPFEPSHVDANLATFAELASTASGRQSLRASRSIEAALGVVDTLCTADVPADAVFAVQFLRSLADLVRTCDKSRHRACKARAERLARTALATWAASDDVHEAGSALLFALAFEDADDPAASALPPAPIPHATDDDDDVMASLMAAMRRQQLDDEFDDEHTSISPSPVMLMGSEDAPAHVPGDTSPPREAGSPITVPFEDEASPLPAAASEADPVLVAAAVPNDSAVSDFRFDSEEEMLMNLMATSRMPPIDVMYQTDGDASSTFGVD